MDAKLILKSDELRENWTRIECSLQDLKIFVKSPAGYYRAVVSLQLENDELNVYVHGCTEKHELRPLAYMLGFNSLSFKMKEQEEGA